MNCADSRDSFSAYLDDALLPGERSGIEAHLAGCGECRRELERFRQTLALLHRVERPRAPVGFVDRVLAAASPVPWYGRALRGLFLIDKNGTVRHMLVNDLPLGRSVEEALRVVDALAHFEKHGEVCPANWKPGAKAMKGDVEGAKSFFSEWGAKK